MKFDSRTMMYGSVLAAGLRPGGQGTTASCASAPTPEPTGTGEHAAGESDTRISLIAQALIPAEVRVDFGALTKVQLLEAAAGLLAASRGIPVGPVSRALLRREEVGSTALGRGIAIPHARIGGIEHPTTIFIRTESPIAFDAPDGRPVSAFLVILVPETGSTDEHLQLLSLVAELACDASFRTLLADTPDAYSVRNLFARWVDRKFRDNGK